MSTIDHEIPVEDQDMATHELVYVVLITMAMVLVTMILTGTLP